MFYDSQANSAAHIKFKLPLSGFDNGCATLSSACAAATEEMVFVRLDFLLLPKQLPLVFISVLHFCSISLHSTSHLFEGDLAINFY